MILQPFDVYHFLNLNLSSKVSVLEDTAFSVFYDNTIPFIKMFIYIYIDVVKNLIHFYVIALNEGNTYLPCLLSNFHKTLKDDTTAILCVLFS